MAITLKEAIAISENIQATSFMEIQNNCTNLDFFNDEKPINKLSSWEGYTYSYSWSGDLILNKDTGISAASDSINVSYGNVYKEVYKNGVKDKEYYNGDIYLTVRLNDSQIDGAIMDNYCYTNSYSSNSQSLSSGVITKLSYGTKEMSSQYYIVDLRLGSVDGEVVISKGFTTVANVAPSDDAVNIQITSTFDDVIQSESGYEILSVYADFGKYTSGDSVTNQVYLSCSFDVNWLWAEHNSNSTKLIYWSDNDGTERCTDFTALAYTYSSKGNYIEKRVVYNICQSAKTVKVLGVFQESSTIIPEYLSWTLSYSNGGDIMSANGGELDASSNESYKFIVIPSSIISKIISLGDSNQYVITCIDSYNGKTRRSSGITVSAINNGYLSFT